MNLLEILNRCEMRADGCVSWAGAHDGKGYAHASVGGRTQRIFRVLYEQFVGRVPEGRLLHHDCRNHLCVNPFHGIPSTSSDHQLVHHPSPQRTHCAHGHELTEGNAYIHRRGRRARIVCRTCEAVRRSTPKYKVQKAAYDERRGAS